ncbi:hypothetical protein KAFR_0H00420 [Kazachstania africana CBS 2517]|uniref:CS domain-containing protein n=1 Tax=Kazachstania africana (strain ATCC 22294 / BCRC 22015 / CBS 2517 / CECT 1963 / NBRC 1671 / NRRL Y-8276) TaxID=1071382 RepID=H2AYP5_KAZAF|nr:hypothetical protein KAFR_0H00420 [Kazachstania africana CBS 2517]CCF59451.1 hypothetical protein KAFR_0H00420 [Kazachstania africana CBS 2517]
MPIETDLKRAYKTLYDDKNPLQALEDYDTILKNNSQNITALVYKAASLEKLYYGFADWHNEETLDGAKSSLQLALEIAKNRGSKSKIGFVNFRFFIHYFNNKEYDEANKFFQDAKAHGYTDPTVHMWEDRLNTKLKKLAKKKGATVTGVDINRKSDSEGMSSAMKDASNIAASNAGIPIQNLALPATNNSVPLPQPQDTPKFRTDWYQTSNSITLSLFTTNLPPKESDVNVTISRDQHLSVSFNIPDTGSEFQYNVKLAKEVVSTDIKIKIFTKKLEITLAKKDNSQWNSLEGTSDDSDVNNNDTTLNYPTSSKRAIDWSKLNIDDEDDNEEQGGSVDGFFQKLYKDADPDTRRAMMKSFVESNGTALNTNWDDVKEKSVETSPPEGMEVKHW